jgi:UDP-N-acetyl-D-mannosaminuronate dehydrogenase
MSFSELRDALNTKWNVNILEPREGIGGHCLPKDTKMFLQSSKSKNKILSAAMQADQNYRNYRLAREGASSSISRDIVNELISSLPSKASSNQPDKNKEHNWNSDRG